MLKQGNAVSFRFDTTGAQKFEKATTDNVGKRFAVILDGVVITAPVINSPITGGSGIITGNFTSQEATDLAVLLRAGALPAPLEIIEESPFKQKEKCNHFYDCGGCKTQDLDYKEQINQKENSVWNLKTSVLSLLGMF